jgi:beta-glucosidase
MIRKVFAFMCVWLFSTGFVFAKPSPPYPSGFLWGAAFSAHQTEGAVDGGENGDWYKFEHPTPPHSSPIYNSDTADVAVDHWNRYEEDLQAAKALGLNTLRTSLAWEKIEPKKGLFNESAMAHYRDEFKRMNQLGIRPMICLNHFTAPNWFEDEGGWTSANSPFEFLEYAKYVVNQLGSYTDLWITFNEPMIMVEQGYLKGETPPLKTGLKNAFEAAFNTARAHRMVVNYIHQVQGLPRNRSNKSPMGGVGLAYAFQVFDPANPKLKEDIQAAQNLTDLSNWDWLRGAETGHLIFTLSVPGKPDQVYQRDLPVTDLPPNPGPVYDWLGVNYYQRYLIAYNPNSPIPFQWITPPGPVTDNGWSIYPEGLERILRDVSKRFSYPMIVTENGLADENDSKRPQFIRDHLQSLDKGVFGSASGPALDVRGYYHWSLMDNFEWLSGYRYKFGLFEIDFKNNLKRNPRPSAWVYRDEIKGRQAR